MSTHSDLLVDIHNGDVSPLGETLDTDAGDELDALSDGAYDAWLTERDEELIARVDAGIYRTAA